MEEEPVVDEPLIAVQVAEEPLIAEPVAEELLIAVQVAEDLTKITKVFFTKDKKIGSHSINLKNTNKILNKYNKKDIITLIKNDKQIKFNIVSKSIIIII